MLFQILLICLASIAIAQPTGHNQLDNALSKTSWAVFESEQWGRHGEPLEEVQLPTAPTPLPTATGRLIHVALGRGVQNYTCSAAITSSSSSASNNTSTPVPDSTGALASLYNITSLLRTTTSTPFFSYFVDSLPSYALTLPNPSFSDDDEDKYNATFTSFDFEMTGKHYFLPGVNATAAPIPHFDLSYIGLGSINAKKVASSDAPVPAVLIKGANAMNATTTLPTNDVPWLYLQAVNGSTAGFAEVYRVRTSGGAAPTTCEGIEGTSISVDYAAEYWFFV